MSVMGMLEQQSYGGASQPRDGFVGGTPESQREALLLPPHHRGATGSSMNIGLGPFELDRWIAAKYGWAWES